MADLSRSAARGAGFTMAAQGVRFVLQMVSLVILSRLLTPAQVGLVAMVTSLTGVAEIIRDFGLSSAAIQRKDLSRTQRDNLFWINLGIGTACAVVVAACAPLIAAFYREPEVQQIVLVMAWLFIVSGANTQYRADLTRRLKFKELALTDILAQVASLIVAVSSAWAGAGYWSIVAQQATFVIATLLLNVGFGRWRPGRYDRSESMRPFFGYGSAVLGTSLMGYALNNADNAAIGAAWGSGPLGLYTRGYQLIMAPLQQLNAPFSRVALPILAKVQDDPATFARYVQRFQLISVYTLALGFGIASGLAGPIVGVLFGPQWSSVAPIFAVLAAGGVFKAFDQSGYQVYLAKGLSKQLVKFYAITRPLMLLTILAGLPWGPVGVAFGQLVAAAGHWVYQTRQISIRAQVDGRPQFVQSARALGCVILPAGVIAHVVAAVLADRFGAAAGVQLLVGALAALAWVIIAALLIPAVRADVVTIRRGLALMRSRG